MWLKLFPRFPYVKIKGWNIVWQPGWECLRHKKGQPKQDWRAGMVVHPEYILMSRALQDINIMNEVNGNVQCWSYSINKHDCKQLMLLLWLNHWNMCVEATYTGIKNTGFAELKGVRILKHASYRSFHSIFATCVYILYNCHCTLFRLFTFETCKKMSFYHLFNCNWPILEMIWCILTQLMQRN